MERTIKVTGRGQVRLKPDLIRLQIGLKGVKKTYAETLALSGQTHADLKAALAAAGFSPEALKTTGFEINTKYENVRGENGEWRQVFAGYEFAHSLKLELAPEGELGRAAAALEGCGPSDLSFVYTVRDPSSAREELLKEAAADARRKAEILAGASGVRLGELLTVEYAFGPRPAESRAMTLRAARAAEADLDFCPDEIELSDSVAMTWAIG